MGSLGNVNSGDAANSSCIQQVIDVLKGTAGAGNVPVSLTAVNDTANYTLDVQNQDGTNTRTFRARDSSGNSRLQLDISGPQADPTGTGLAPILTTNATQTLTNKTLTDPTINGTAGFGAWSTFTPAVNQPTALTFTNVVSRYTRFGKAAMVTMQVTLTQPGTSGNDISLSNLPVVGLNPGVQACVGSFQYRGTTFRAGSAILSAANTIKLQVDNNIGFLGTVPGIALSSGETISVTVLLETT